MVFVGVCLAWVGVKGEFGLVDVVKVKMFGRDLFTLVAGRVWSFVCAEE